jgi:hypothetical protein
MFQPACPGKMADLARRLGLAEVPTLGKSRTLPLAGLRVAKGPPLFPKVEVAANEPG